MTLFDEKTMSEDARPSAAGADPRSVPRLEDVRLLRGEGLFHENVVLDGLTFAAFARSELAHGRIRRINVSQALDAPGVIAVFTAEDLPDWAIPARQPTPGLDFTPYLQTPLATGWVRHVGQAFAVVVATTSYAAEDAAALIDVDIEPEPPLLDARQADGRSIVSLAGAPARVGTVTSEFGDVDVLFAGAPVVVECKLSLGRQTGMPLETRG